MSDVVQIRDYERKPRRAAAPGCHIVGFKSREVLELEAAAVSFEQAARDLNAMVRSCLAMTALVDATARMLAVQNLESMARAVAFLSGPLPSAEFTLGRPCAVRVAGVNDAAPPAAGYDSQAEGSPANLV